MGTTITVHTTINEIVQEDMHRSGLLQDLGIDTCCGGQRTLSEACKEIGIDPENVLKQLTPKSDLQESSTSPDAGKDWSQSSLTDLIAHIESTHHKYLKLAFPRLSSLISKVKAAHEARHPELGQLEAAFQALRSDLEPHLMKEENVLFPMARKLDAGESEFHCGSLQAPIRVMLMEHERADRLQEKLVELTNHFAMPEDGCASYRTMLEELKAMKSDLDIHIQKENEILFPMILEEEQNLAP